MMAHYFALMIAWMGFVLPFQPAIAEEKYAKNMINQSLQTTWGDMTALMGPIEFTGRLQLTLSANDQSKSYYELTDTLRQAPSGDYHVIKGSLTSEKIFEAYIQGHHAIITKFVNGAPARYLRTTDQSLFELFRNRILTTWQELYDEYKRFLQFERVDAVPIHGFNTVVIHGSLDPRFQLDANRQFKRCDVHFYIEPEKWVVIQAQFFIEYSITRFGTRSHTSIRYNIALKPYRDKIRIPNVSPISTFNFKTNAPPLS